MCLLLLLTELNHLVRGVGKGGGGSVDGHLPVGLLVENVYASLPAKPSSCAAVRLCKASDPPPPPHEDWTSDRQYGEELLGRGCGEPIRWNFIPCMSLATISGNELMEEFNRPRDLSPTSYRDPASDPLCVCRTGGISCRGPEMLHSAWWARGG